MVKLTYSIVRANSVSCWENPHPHRYKWWMFIARRCPFNATTQLFLEKETLKLFLRNN